MRGLLRHDYGEDNMDEPVDHASIAGHFERELIAARAEIDKLRESCEAYKGQVQAGAAEIERLQEAKRRALAVADERSKENVALRQENERLRADLAALNLCEPGFLDRVIRERDAARAALKPFADDARHYAPYPEHMENSMVGGMFTLKQLRAAARALEQSPTKE